MNGEEKRAGAVAPAAGKSEAKRSDSWIGLLVGFLFFAFCMLFLGIGLDGFLNFVDIPTFSMLLGTVLGGWMIAYGAGRTFSLLRLAIAARAADKNEAQSVVAFCSCGIWLSLLGGAVGTIIGLINMLANGYPLSAAGLSMFTSGLAVDIVTFFWSWILAILLVALRYRASETVRRLECAKDADGLSEA